MGSLPNFVPRGPTGAPSFLPGRIQANAQTAPCERASASLDRKLCHDMSLYPCVARTSSMSIILTTPIEEAYVDQLV